MFADFLTTRVAVPDFAAERVLREKGIQPQTLANWGVRWTSEPPAFAIPYRDLQGALIGVVERLYDGKGPTYDNGRYWQYADGSRPMGQFLFGLDRVLPSSEIILVEGFWDTMKLHQEGYVNALGLIGTRATGRHQKLLQELFPSASLLWVPDGDSPGRKWLQQPFFNHEARRIALPAERDPDNLSREELLQLLGAPLRA
jgi:DNA primase